MKCVNFDLGITRAACICLLQLRPVTRHEKQVRLNLILSSLLLSYTSVNYKIFCFHILPTISIHALSPLLNLNLKTL